MGLPAIVLFNIDIPSTAVVVIGVVILICGICMGPSGKARTPQQRNVPSQNQPQQMPPNYQRQNSVVNHCLTSVDNQGYSNQHNGQHGENFKNTVNQIRQQQNQNQNGNVRKR